MTPKLLDLYCGQGICAKGYADVGFEVLGVDIDPQPRYPYPFIQSDALEFLLTYGPQFRSMGVVAIHASPPCQRYSWTQRINDREHPDLVLPTRLALRHIGLPYVIENVEGAPLIDPVTLCGAMFGLRTYRHRLFEAYDFVLPQPEHPEHVAPQRKMGRAPQPGDMIHAVGNFSGVELVRQDWGTPWANREGLREGVPPAYTRFVGEHMMEELA